jgi:hypothetical protein
MRALRGRSKGCPLLLLCAEHVRQLGGESPLLNLIGGAKARADEQEPDKRHTASGELATRQRSPYPSRMLVVNSAAGALKAVELTSGDLLRVAQSRLRLL